MKTAAEAVKEYIKSKPALAKRAGFCEACGKYYDRKYKHECLAVAKRDESK